MEQKSTTLYGYKQLTRKEQYHLLITKGTHVDSVSWNSLTFKLYNLNNFFVEVVYHKSSNIIKRERAFLGGKILDKYVPWRQKDI